MGIEEDLSISPAVSTAIGSFAGVVEVALQQPLVAWKNALQVTQLPAKLIDTHKA